MLATIVEQVTTAKQAAAEIGQMPSEQKDAALVAMAAALVTEQAAILAANEQDLAAAKQMNLSSALIDRLTLTPARIAGMATALSELAQMASPIGEVLASNKHTNGMLIDKIRVPIGVIAIIYESRPNVTSDVVGICLKSGNAIILKGGKEALHSNRAISKVLQVAISQVTGSNAEFIQFIDATEREATNILLKQNDGIDLIIPRGGKGLITAIMEQTNIPVLKHLHGVCHAYVDNHADLSMATDIIINGKCQRPGVCNALETLLIHQDIAQPLLTKLYPLLAEHKVLVHGCAQTRNILKEHNEIIAATEDDWYTEYLDYELAVRVVHDYHAAIAHINHYGSKHSDVIITRDNGVATEFMRQVDSATVYHNASTRFTDGGEFGKGAEMGISTDKLHARGPVGIEELTTYKYCIYGQGQIRE